MEGNEEGEVITVDLSPLYPNLIDEQVAHEYVFRWPDEMQLNNTATFLRVTTVREANRNESSKQWTNLQDVIDITGRSSLVRILLIRDITKRLRDLDDSRDMSKKLLTGNSFTEIFFKLDGIIFKLRLNPTNDQPGNARLTMYSPSHDKRIFKHKHNDIEEFECFRELGAETIHTIVTRARNEGKRITIEDIDSDTYMTDYMKEKMEEQLTFFMLIYDFEIARRLQRPFVNESQDYDSLPIGIGIAFNHLSNKQSGNDIWEFKSRLFQGKPESRKECLDKIIDHQRDQAGNRWTHSELIDLLYHHFGRAHPI